MTEQSVSNVASCVYGGTAFVNHYYYPGELTSRSPQPVGSELEEVVYLRKS